MPHRFKGSSGSAATANDDETVAQAFGLAEAAEWQRLVDWLTGLHMQHYVSIFHDQGLTRLSSLELLDESDLAEIGIEETDRVPLLRGIQAFSLRTREWTNSALFQSVSYVKSHQWHPLLPPS